MRRFFSWYFEQKAIVRFLLMFLFTFGSSVVIMLIVNALTHEPWYRGIFGGLVAGALLSAWSLSDKRFYDQNNRTNKNDKR